MLQPRCFTKCQIDSLAATSIYIYIYASSMVMQKLQNGTHLLPAEATGEPVPVELKQKKSEARRRGKDLTPKMISFN